MGQPNLANRQIDPQVAELMTAGLVWDNHGCMPLRPDDEEFLPRLQRYRDAGVDVASLNVGFDAVAWEHTLLVLAHFRAWLRRRPKTMCSSNQSAT